MTSRFPAGAAVFAAALAICSCAQAPKSPQTAAPKATPAQAPPAAAPAPAAAPGPAPARARAGASSAPAPAPLPPPVRLPRPPAIVKAVYFTSWSAGIRSRIDYLLSLRETTGVNAVVFDVKDYSGYVNYRTAAEGPKEYGAIRVTVRDIDALVRRLHEAGIYVIARITCFQDPILAQARPDIAVHSRSKLKGSGDLTPATLWRDRKGLAWIDPAARPAWKYLVSIGHDLLSHGVDELNFDYVRFPSDGNLRDFYFPVWDGASPKRATIAAFFEYLRKELPGVPLSGDLFGLATVQKDDLGIGQIIEDAYAAFDYVCPMVYPSHFARKFLGFANPAEHPGEVVGYSMQHALTRLAATHSKAKLRPWLQDFNLGAKYDARMVRAQIDAARAALGDRYAGYMIWAPSNVYNAAALKETPAAASVGSTETPK